MEKEDMIPLGICCTHYEVEMTFIRSLEDAGLLSVTRMDNEQYLSHGELGTLEKFMRLHDDLDINPEGLEVISHLLEKIEVLQQEIGWLKERLRIFES